MQGLLVSLDATWKVLCADLIEPSRPDDRGSTRFCLVVLLWKDPQRT